MYPPKHHQEYDPVLIQKVALQYPFATLVSAENDIPLVTHLPLILKENKLVGHLDLNNPHTELLKENKSVVAIFRGPQTYISPSIYTSKQLPTWNYLISHAYGSVEEITDPKTIKQSMVDMTDYLEGSEGKFTLDIDDPRMDRLLPYIHCFEIHVQKWEGKFKISQDKSVNDIENAKQELIKNNQTNIEDFISSIYTEHFHQSK